MMMTCRTPIWKSIDTKAEKNTTVGRIAKHLVGMMGVIRVVRSILIYMEYGISISPKNPYNGIFVPN